MHTIGDAAVRTALDAVEAAISANGPRPDRRPVLAHVQLIDEADRPRLAALGVIANAEPLWAQLDDVMEALTVPRLGEPRASAQYPWATLRDPFALTDPGALAKVRVARTWLRGRSLSG